MSNLEMHDPAECILSNLENGPVLINSDGTIIPMPNPELLLDTNIHDGALWVIGPHGEIAPFAATACLQKTISSGSRLFHLDAHLDNRREMNGHSSAVTRDRVAALMNSGEKERALRELVRTTRSDIATFIHGLSDIFGNFTGLIRPENSMAINYYNTSVVEDFGYAPKIGTPTGVMSNFDDIGLVSIDGDFVAVRSEEKECKPENAQGKRRQRVLDELRIHAEQHDVGKRRNKGTVYGLSLDKEWVDDPREFLEHFLFEFYLPKIASRKLV